MANRQRQIMTNDPFMVWYKSTKSAIIALRKEGRKLQSMLRANMVYGFFFHADEKKPQTNLV